MWYYPVQYYVAPVVPIAPVVVCDNTPAKKTANPANTANAQDNALVSHTSASKYTDRALIHVNLPKSARLFIDGTATQEMELAERTILTPKLREGVSYHYVLRVEVDGGSNANVQERRISFRPGQEVTVDFNRKGNGLVEVIAN